MEQKFHDHPPTPQQQEKVLLLFSAVGLVAASGGKDIPIEVEFDGLTRKAILHLPPEKKKSCDAEGSCSSEKFPLVIDLHPLGFDGKIQQEQSGFSELADVKRYVLVTCSKVHTS